MIQALSTLHSSRVTSYALIVPMLALHLITEGIMRLQGARETGAMLYNSAIQVYHS